MQSVNNSYLFSIISRVINDTLKNDPSNFWKQATAAEIVLFVKSNPYLHADVKDFMLDHNEYDHIIISNAWEIAFIKNCSAWAAECESSKTKNIYVQGTNLQSDILNAVVLKLPY